MTYEEFDKRCDELKDAPLLDCKAFFADVLAKETEKTDVRMMAYFRYALLFYREGDYRTAREILEPFIIDYQSYQYRPEIIACFNLIGVAAYYVQEYALARFYIHEGLKIAQEHSEISRYAYEYNNLAVTYLAQQNYEKALEAIREAELQPGPPGRGQGRIRALPDPQRQRASAGGCAAAGRIAVL